jgi:SAM-dependent MidA family methyltransferase
MTIDPGFRRPPPPGPPPDGDPVLAARIRDEILSDGPITFARFMELALYDPERGYYRSTEARPGRAGDFLTVPETHPIFGRAIARVLADMWETLGRPEEFTLREFGAGSGTLAVAILDGLRADGSGLLDALRYDPVEIGEARLAELEARLAAIDAAGRPAGPLLRRAGRGAGPIVGCVLANEYLDALPVHRVELREGRLLELHVGWRTGGTPEPAPGLGGAFVDVAGPPSGPALAARLEAEGIVLDEGQRAEVCLGVDAWIAEVAASLSRGFVLAVDYGYPAAELYGPTRRDGTLRAYVRHAVGRDPYVRVGRQDLTAHVDVTAVLAAAERSGLDVLGVTTQAEFLVGAGLPELLAAIQADPATTLADYLALRGSLARMLDPGVTGAFRVVVLGRDLPPDGTLRALSFRLRR